MKCATHDCKNEAVKGCYCLRCWEEVQAIDYEEGNEDQNVPDENTGNFPY